MAYPIRQLTPRDFPKLLQEIPDCPKALYLRGEMPPEELKWLCVVGSRACSPYGRRQTAKLIAGLANYPIAIISGLALGLDSEAHKAALDVGLPTLAVLPSSVDDASIYPSSNRALAQRILARGGGLVSEYPAPNKAQLYGFPARDRLMAGLSHATLITEAGEKSGTLITARLALDYNREVMGIPHELDREGGMGVNRLIREGATLIRDSDDILQVLGIKPSDKPTQPTLPTDLTPAEAAILTALVEPMFKDDLIDASLLSAQDANIALSSLQIRGLLVERLGKVERT